jgi:hypothetical protein
VGLFKAHKVVNLLLNQRTLEYLCRVIASLDTSFAADWLFFSFWTHAFNLKVINKNNQAKPVDMLLPNLKCEAIALS